MPAQDFYEVLGISRQASQQEVKKAYKKLVRQFHPDVAEDKAAAEKQMGVINEAYGVLSDEEKRAYYDRYGAAPGTSQPGMGGADFGGSGFGFPFGDIFEGIFGGMGGQRGNVAARGRHIQVEVTVTLEEAYTGVKRDVKYSVEETCLSCQGKLTTEPDGLVTCSTCGGSGQVRRQLNLGIGVVNQVVPCTACEGRGKIVKKPCKECRGRGLVVTEKHLEVNVPAGVDTGVTLRISGKGEPGINGGPPGNLLVVVQVEDSEEFEREGADLLVKRRVTFTDAALGSSAEIKLVSGNTETITIPAGTQSGSTFRLRSKGMPHLGRSGFGDLHVVVEVMVPTKLNAKQKSLLKEFAQAGSQDAEPSKSGLFGRIRDAIFG